jgi:hypothetical protein
VACVLGSKGKGACKDAKKAAHAISEATSLDGNAAAEEFDECSAVALATMDIFAGCGGLSEGMHQV